MAAEKDTKSKSVSSRDGLQLRQSYPVSSPEETLCRACRCRAGFGVPAYLAGGFNELAGNASRDKIVCWPSTTTNNGIICCLSYITLVVRIGSIDLILLVRQFLVSETKSVLLRTTIPFSPIEFLGFNLLHTKQECFTCWKAYKITDRRRDAKEYPDGDIELAAGYRCVT